jgi:hypothetical protein
VSRLQAVPDDVEERAAGMIRLAVDSGRTPDVYTIAERCGLTVGQVSDLRDRMYAGKRPTPRPAAPTESPGGAGEAARRLAVRMIRAAIESAVRPDVERIAESTGMSSGRVRDLAAAELAARRAAAGTPDPGTYAAALHAAADQLAAQAAALRAMARTLPRHLADDAGHVCPCGRVFATAHALAVHTTRTHKEGAAQ